jgi:hypothetical protein
MKKALLSIGIALGMATVSIAQDATWFDLANCEVCKNMSGHEEIMQEVKWEAHPIANGMMSITVVPAKHKELMAKAKKGMDATIKKLEAGEKMNLCGFCQSFGKLKQAGAKFEEINTAGGMVTLITSNDDKVVKMIHEHVKRTNAETKKMMELQKRQHKGHER